MCTSESESMTRNVYNESKWDQIWFHVDLKKKNNDWVLHANHVSVYFCVKKM